MSWDQDPVARRWMPDKLVRVADHIIEGDPRTAAGRDRLAAAIKAVMSS